MICRRLQPRSESQVSTSLFSWGCDFWLLMIDACNGARHYLGQNGIKNPTQDQFLAITYNHPNACSSYVTALRERDRAHRHARLLRAELAKLVREQAKEEAQKEATQEESKQEKHSKTSREPHHPAGPEFVSPPGPSLPPNLGFVPHGIGKHQS